jgi:hypothetical protein
MILVYLTQESILEKRYQAIESKVLASLQKMRQGNISDKIDIYGDAVVFILAHLGSMKQVSIYRRKRVPLHYTKFVKRLEQLLEKISDSKFFSDYGFGRTAIDLIGIDVETKLDEFLGIKQDKKAEVQKYASKLGDNYFFKIEFHPINQNKI